MAISFTLLTSGSSDTNSQSSISTASVTPSANALVLVVVHGQGFNDATMPASLTGNGLTYVKIEGDEGVANGGYGGGGFEHFSLWRAMGASPSAGAITIGTGTGNSDQLEWHILEATGVDTSGTNGSGAVVKSVIGVGTGTAGSVTLGAGASDATFGCFGGYNGTAVRTGTVGTGFTELADTGLAGSFTNDSCYSEYVLSDDTSVDMTWSGTQTDWAGIAIGIKAAADTLMPQAMM